MNERTYTFDLKSAWGDGPWQHEPDKVVWVDDATNLDCMIVRNRVGSLCGYVGVPESHPWHGLDYDAIDVDVHGGLTAPKAGPRPSTPFATPCNRAGWVGFDTAHLYDLSPAIAALDEMRRAQRGLPADVYRDLDYVRNETLSLAKQAVDAGA